MSARPIASVSLDLDHVWSYLRTHGDPDWEQRPSYLGVTTTPESVRKSRIGQAYPAGSVSERRSRIARAGQSNGSEAYSGWPALAGNTNRCLRSAARSGPYQRAA